MNYARVEMKAHINKSEFVEDFEDENKELEFYLGCQ